MRKLKLEIDKLEVQSFEAEQPGERAGGTINAREHAPTGDGTCRQWTCDGTCDQTCGPPASCDLLNTYCGTYPEQGCPNSIWYCTNAEFVC